MAKKISDAMTTNPCAIDADKSVQYAAKMMRDENVGFAPIVEGMRLIGALTDRDIATLVVAEGKDPEETTARDIATRNVVTVGPDEDLDAALQLMARHQVRRIRSCRETDSSSAWSRRRTSHARPSRRQPARSSKRSRSAKGFSGRVAGQVRHPSSPCYGQTGP